MIGSWHALAIVRKCAAILCCGGLLYVGDACSRCVALIFVISFEVAIVCAVLFELAFVTIGTRFRAWSTTISTTRRCSLVFSVCVSFVELYGTRKWIFSLICYSTRSRSATLSMVPLVVNGVMSAVLTLAR